MSTKQHSAPATTVQATVAIPATLRAVRVARIQQALHARRIADKQQSHVVRTNHANQQAYMLAAQQLAAQYGLPVPNTLSVRPFNKPQQHAPSAVQGACGRVHAIAAANQGVRAATLAQCKAEGINPATAATQFAKWSKANKAAMADQQ